MGKLGASQPGPKLGTPQPGGELGQINKQVSTTGGQLPFMPKQYDGARKTNDKPGETSSTNRGNLIPFLPNKPE